LVVIWLLALAWSGTNRAGCVPVPRRLVWVVNRRVLVQQVFAIAEELLGKLTASGFPDLSAVRNGLRAVSGNCGAFFDVVQLRGQIVANRDWAIRPTVPQLIIGTVDQIGSRLLFQGYGLGKWGRPQQAGLLGVDSWVAVDEAHLVPAFVLTLRQLRERCASPVEDLPPPFDAVFGRLPFWLTEVSATPGLPPPSTERSFSLTEEEKTRSGHRRPDSCIGQEAGFRWSGCRRAKSQRKFSGKDWSQPPSLPRLRGLQSSCVKLESPMRSLPDSRRRASKKTVFAGLPGASAAMSVIVSRSKLPSMRFVWRGQQTPQEANAASLSAPQRQK